MKFSVLVPIYNVEPYLKKCIDSILGQSYTDFEVILVDDGSPDNCGIICDEYAKADNRVKVIHKENGGLVSARQSGIKAATGEYIVNVDSDDWIDSEYLMKANEIVEAHHPDVITFSINYVHGDNEENVCEPFPEGLYDRKGIEKTIHPMMILDDNAQHSFYYLCGKAIKRSILTDIQLSVSTAISLGEDVSCLIPTYIKAQSVYVSYYPVYFVLQREDSDSSLFKLKQFDQLIAGIERLRSIAKEGIPQDINKQIDRYVFHMCLVLLVGAASSKNGKKLLPQITEKIKDPVLKEGINRAEFSNISAKSSMVLKLLRKNRVSEAFYLLKAVECLKGKKG